MASITYPYTFATGATIFASEMNANFAVITAQVNGNLDANNLAGGAVTDAKIATGIDAAKLSSGIVSNTEFDYLNGVTGAIQAQLDVNTAKVTNATHTGDATGSTALTIADAAVTPAKTSFLPDNMGASGIIHGGMVLSDGTSFGTAPSPPPGWVVQDIGGAGRYRISHNLGTTDYLPFVGASNTGGTDVMCTVTNHTSNYFNVVTTNNGSYTAIAFFFMVIRF